jgi:hypothetical protein
LAAGTRQQRRLQDQAALTEYLNPRGLHWLQSRGTSWMNPLFHMHYAASSTTPLAYRHR